MIHTFDAGARPNGHFSCNIRKWDVAAGVFAYKGARESLSVLAGGDSSCQLPPDTGIVPRCGPLALWEHLFMARSALRGANSGNKSRACYCCRSKRLMALQPSKREHVIPPPAWKSTDKWNSAEQTKVAFGSHQKDIREKCAWAFVQRWTWSWCRPISVCL